MSSYFQTIRRLKDAQHYINSITSQFALYRATQDQVDNPRYKSFNRQSSNRLICKEVAAKPLKQLAEFYIPTVPQEPGPPDPGPGGGGPNPVGSTTVMINFDQELRDRSNNKNDAIAEFTNNQLVFTEGRDSTMGFAVNFNQNSNSTFDKLWIPFSNSTQIVYDTPSGFSLLMRIKPWTLSNLGTAQTTGPAPVTNRIKYFGGPVLNKYNPLIYNIWWGSSWNSGTPLSRKNTLINDMNTICSSQHYDGMWQYGGIKKPSVAANIVWTSTAVPSAQVIPDSDVVNMIQDVIDSGQVPNPDLSGEPFPANGAQIDYRHIYFVMIPFGKLVQHGAGYAFQTWRNQYRGGTQGTVYWLYGALNPPEFIRSDFPQYNHVQMCEQAWAHEIFHKLESAFSGAACDAVSQGFSGYLYSVPPECSGLQHASPGCGSRLRLLSNTNVLTESYWSDMDGKCIAPGSGDTWTPAPTPTTGTTIRRYLFQKLDDLDNGATAALGSDGVIYFNVKKAGVEYKRKTAIGAIVANQWADVWFNFNHSTNTPTIYVNNTPHSVASTEVLLWNNSHSHFIIANYNLGAVTGQYRGALDDFRLYRNMVTTAQQVDNFDSNGLTITPVNIDNTQGVAIVNRCKIDSKLEKAVFVPTDVVLADVPTELASFTPTSFTTTSFTI